MAGEVSQPWETYREDQDVIEEPPEGSELLHGDDPRRAKILYLSGTFFEGADALQGGIDVQWASLAFMVATLYAGQTDAVLDEGLKNFSYAVRVNHAQIQRSFNEKGMN